MDYKDKERWNSSKKDNMYTIQDEIDHARKDIDDTKTDIVDISEEEDVAKFGMLHASKKRKLSVRQVAGGPTIVAKKTKLTREEECSAAYKAITTTFTKMEKMVTHLQQLKYFYNDDDFDHDKVLIVDDLSDEIKELYLSSYFCSNDRSTFYHVFYNYDGIPRLLSLLDALTANNYNMKYEHDDIDNDNANDNANDNNDDNTFVTAKVERIVVGADPRKQYRRTCQYNDDLETPFVHTVVSKAYLFLFLFKIMNCEEDVVSSSSSRSTTHTKDNITKKNVMEDLCKKMKEEFIQQDGIQLLIEFNKESIVNNRMTDMNTIWIILSMIVVGQPTLLDEDTKHQLFDSSLDTLTLLSKRNDDDYVVSTLNAVFHFLHRFIPLSYRHHHERQRKKRIIPIIALAMKNPTRTYTSEFDMGYRKGDNDDDNSKKLWSRSTHICHEYFSIAKNHVVSDNDNDNDNDNDKKEDLKNVNLFMKEVATQLCQQIQAKKWNVRKRRPLLSRDYSSDVSDVGDWCSTDAKC